VECTRPNHKQYSGRNQILRPNGKKIDDKDSETSESATIYAEWIDSEVMIDFVRVLPEIPGWRPNRSV
jgi:hypothetical protein